MLTAFGEGVGAQLALHRKPPCQKTKCPMLEEPTCLILGAGASAPYGLPTAAKLKQLILADVMESGRQAADEYPLRNPPYVVSMGEKYKHAHQWGQYLRDLAQQSGVGHLVDPFWKRLSGSARSVNWFLRNNSEYEKIAKLFIAAVLLKCETPPGPRGDWYEEFCHQVFSTHEYAFTSGMLSVVTFNYDRSFEQFLLTVLESDYNLSRESAQSELRKVPLEPVYGKLGDLHTIPYGDTSSVLAAAEGIFLTRATANKEIQTRIQPLIRAATYVNFVGFSFDADNLALLGHDPFKGKRVYATSRGLSIHAKDRARALGVRFQSKRSDSTALDLLTNFKIFGPKHKPTLSRAVRRQPPFVRNGVRSPWKVRL